MARQTRQNALVQCRDGRDNVWNIRISWNEGCTLTCAKGFTDVESVFHSNKSRASPSFSHGATIRTDSRTSTMTLEQPLTPV